MSLKDTLSVAERIRRPASVIALAIIVAAVVGLALVKALPTEKMVGEAVARLLFWLLIVVGVVVLVGLLTYLLKGDKQARIIEAQTKGKDAPGVVVGNVNRNVTKAASARMREIPNVDRISADTEGDGSPGVVLGDVNVNEKKNG